MKIKINKLSSEIKLETPEEIDTFKEIIQHYMGTSYEDSEEYPMDLMMCELEKEFCPEDSNDEEE